MRATAAASPSVMATSLAATATCLGSDALRRRDAAATRASSSVTTRWPFSTIPSKGALSLASVATYKASRGARTLRAASTLLWPLNWKSFSRSWRLLYAASAPLTAGVDRQFEPGDDGRGRARHAVAVADEVADQPLVQVLLGVVDKIDVGVEGHEQPPGAVDVPPVRTVRRQPAERTWATTALVRSPRISSPSTVSRHNRLTPSNLHSGGSWRTFATRASTVAASSVLRALLSPKSTTVVSVWGVSLWKWRSSQS